MLRWAHSLLAPNRAVAGLDFLVDAVVVAFALWTVVFHFSVAFSWHRNVAIGLWFVTLFAAGAGAIRAQRRGFGLARADIERPEPESGARDDVPEAPPFGRLGFTLFVAAALGVAAFGAYVRGPAAWWLFSALVVVMASAAVIIVLRSRAPTTRHQLSSTTPSWRGISLVVGIAVLFALGSAFTQRPDADDVSYLSRAVHAEQRSGAFATRDTVYSDQAYLINVSPTRTAPTAIEPLTGMGALLTPFTSPTIAYLVVGPLVSALSIFALWRLVRTLGAPSPALATFGTALFLVLNGDRHASFGNFGFVRSWQGKAIFVAVIVPLLWHYALAWGRGRDRSSWVGLLATNTAGIGLTSTAYLVAPTVTLVGLACSARGRRAGRRFMTGVATLAYPLAVLLVSRLEAIPSPTYDRDPMLSLGLLATPLASIVGALDAGARFVAGVLTDDSWHILRYHWDRIFGDGLPMVVAIGALLGAWLFVRDQAGRLALAVLPAVLMLVYFSPIAAQIPQNTRSFDGAGANWWRSAWVAPVPALVGVTVASPVLISRAWLRRLLGAGLAVGMVAAMTVGRMTVLSPDNSRLRFGSLEWDVEPVPRAAAARALSMAERGDIVAAPQEVGEVLTVMSADVHPLLVRDLTFAVPAFQPSTQIHGRRVVHDAITGGLGVERVDEFRAALAALRIRVVVATHDAIGDLALTRVLRRADFVEVHTDVHYSYWRRA